MTLHADRRRKMLRALNSGGGGADLNYAACMGSITTPVDTTQTVPFYLTHCSTGAIEIDSVAAGAGIVVINGAWRLS